ncbi:hypothetical protein LINPERPRIM_LOCUS5718 [Linum perenne]
MLVAQLKTEVMVKGTSSGGPGEGVRDYRVWTKKEEHTLVECMRYMAEHRQVEKGNFRAPGLKELQRMMHERIENCPLLEVSHVKSKVRYLKDKFTALLQLKEASGFGWDESRGCIVADESVFAGWVKSHPKVSGLNNKPVPYWDDLCFIFGVDQALGVDAVQPADAASNMKARTGLSDYMDTDNEQVDSYTIPAAMDHNAVMADLINQGIDMHATKLKEVEAEVTAKTVKGKDAASSSSVKRTRQQLLDEDRARMAAHLAAATENLGKIASSYCIDVDISVKRQFLYQELARFGELTSNQRTRALRHLNRDDGDANTFFQFPTDEEKLEFVWSILERSCAEVIYIYMCYDFCGMQTNQTKEDLVNAGYDIHAKELKEAEAQSSTQAKGKSSTASSGQKKTRQQANKDLLSSIDGKMDKMTETIAETTHNIARMTYNFCIHDDTTMRQKMLYVEMEKFSELTRI